MSGLKAVMDALDVQSEGIPYWDGLDLAALASSESHHYATDPEAVQRETDQWREIGAQTLLLAFAAYELAGGERPDPAVFAKGVESLKYLIKHQTTVLERTSRQGGEE